MPVTTLTPAETARWQSARLTYREVGASVSDGDLPRGYHNLRVHRVVAHGEDGFAAARRLLWDWQVQARAGVRVRASGPVARGAVAVLRLAIGPVGVDAPVRVVWLEDGDDRCGFAYGTLPGHPEQGEEAFLLHRGPDGAVTFEVVAFSRPATWLTRLGGPAGRGVQRLAAHRYLRALDQAR